MRYERWGPPLLRLAIPFLSAFLLLQIEHLIGAIAQDRPGIIPVAMLSLVFGLLMPAVRRWLIVTLCFGVSLLALRDTFRDVPLPPAINYVFVDKIYPFGWGMLALLAGLAGIGEALRPGALWARRCYFGAASLYFLGHGSVSFMKYPNWQSAVMAVVGLVSFAGVFMADRVVDEEDEEEPVDEDIREMANRSAQRSTHLASREWRESG